VRVVNEDTEKKNEEWDLERERVQKKRGSLKLFNSLLKGRKERDKLKGLVETGENKMEWKTKWGKTPHRKSRET